MRSRSPLTRLLRAVLRTARAEPAVTLTQGIVVEPEKPTTVALPDLFYRTLFKGKRCPKCGETLDAFHSCRPGAR